MRLSFLDRERELGRLERALSRPEGALLCLYGRRRVGKSRLLERLLERRQAVYFVGDERDAPLQREALARQVSTLLPTFGDVSYPGWEPLLERWWREAPDGAVLALDEFPYLVKASPELPSLLRKLFDRPRDRGSHLILCGSSQRMMQGLVLDASAPLYGRAREIVRLEPLEVGWLPPALGLRSPADAVEHFAGLGGVPRYWELRADYDDLWEALAALVLDPLGVLHREAERLLLDDLEQVARAASVLALVGQGCHRVSEIGSRLGVPATSLARPLARLVELGFLAHEVPFGHSPRDTKRTSYRLRDPLLRFIYRFVEPNRSRLAVGQVAAVAEEIRTAWPVFLGAAWEELARESVPRLRIGGQSWGPAGRWWGPGSDRRPLELDIVAATAQDPELVLVGEAKLGAEKTPAAMLVAELERRAARCPALQGKRCVTALWLLRAPRRADGGAIFTAAEVVAALR